MAKIKIEVMDGPYCLDENAECIYINWGDYKEFCDIFGNDIREDRCKLPQCISATVEEK